MHKQHSYGARRPPTSIRKGTSTFTLMTMMSGMIVFAHFLSADPCDEHDLINGIRATVDFQGQMKRCIATIHEVPVLQESDISRSLTETFDRSIKTWSSHSQESPASFHALQDNPDLLERAASTLDRRTIAAYLREYPQLVEAARQHPEFESLKRRYSEGH